MSKKNIIEIIDKNGIQIIFILTVILLIFTVGVDIYRDIATNGRFNRNDLVDKTIQLTFLSAMMG